MIIHAHALPRAPYIPTLLHAPLFCHYEFLQSESWGPTDHLMPCWATYVDGLQFGLQWTEQQRRDLRSYTPFKTYEIRKGARPSLWVGIERIGYLLPEGFLPLRITYRGEEDIERVVMPGNVGYLYNYLLKMPQPVCGGIAPQLQFVLDIDTTSERNTVPIRHYQVLQQLVPHLVSSGPHLAFDIRSQTDAHENLQMLSQSLDVLGNTRWDCEEGAGRIMDWVYEYLIVEPPIRDTAVLTYPIGPIPLPVLYTAYGTGVIDTTIPPPLTVPSHARVLPDKILQDILGLQATDLLASFPILGGILDQRPLHYVAQNRFGAYVPLQHTEDQTRVRMILSQARAAANALNLTDGIAMLQLTCNEEVKLCFGDHMQPEKHLCFYADFNDVTDSWRGVAQTPPFTQRA